METQVFSEYPHRDTEVKRPRTKTETGFVQFMTAVTHTLTQSHTHTITNGEATTMLSWISVVKAFNETTHKQVSTHICTDPIGYPLCLLLQTYQTNQTDGKNGNYRSNLPSSMMFV